MQSPPTPSDEAERLAELRAYGVLDTLPEQAYDDITYLASQLCDAPIALVSLVDEDRQWFKSRVGIDAAETERDVAFCAHAINDPGELLVVPDAAADDRFAANPLVTDDPSIRFYAGAPLVTGSGNALGTLCVIDTRPRELDEQQAEALRALSRQVMAQLELRRAVSDLEDAVAARRRYEVQLEDYQRKLEASLAVASAQSVTDALTGLKNRRALLDKLGEEVSRSRRYGTPVSLAMVDVDEFKPYNDAYGHPAGDAVLERVAHILAESSRSTDFVARYGGEEFAVVLTDTDAEGGYVLAERFHKSIERADWPKRAVTVSVGVATMTGSTAGAASLVAEADAALYRAKQAGRNRVAAADRAA